MDGGALFCIRNSGESWRMLTLKVKKEVRGFVPARRVFMQPSRGCMCFFSPEVGKRFATEFLSKGKDDRESCPKLELAFQLPACPRRGDLVVSAWRSAARSRAPWALGGHALSQS